MPRFRVVLRFLSVRVPSLGVAGSRRVDKGTFRWIAAKKRKSKGTHILRSIQWRRILRGVASKIAGTSASLRWAGTGTPRCAPRCWPARMRQVKFSRFFPNDLRCGFRKLKEEGVGNRRSGAAVVPKSLLVLLLSFLCTPRPPWTRFYLLGSSPPHADRTSPPYFMYGTPQTMRGLIIPHASPGELAYGMIRSEGTWCFFVQNRSSRTLARGASLRDDQK